MNPGFDPPLRPAALSARAPALTGLWSTTATVTVGGSGMGTCSDPNPPAGQAFYRTSR